MSGWARLATEFYRFFLACYPAVFRAEFGEEMQNNFQSALIETQHRGGGEQAWQLLWRELRDWPGSVLQEHLRARKKKITEHDLFAPIKTGDVLAALTIFLIPSLATMLLEILGVTMSDRMPEWAGPFLVIIFLGSLIVPLVLAIIRGFPRWSSPYLGVLLVGFTFFVPFWRIWELIYPSVTRWFGNMYSWTMSIRIFVQGMQAALIWSAPMLGKHSSNPPMSKSRP